jgi:hypothetical protein
LHDVARFADERFGLCPCPFKADGGDMGIRSGEDLTSLPAQCRKRGTGAEAATHGMAETTTEMSQTYAVIDATTHAVAEAVVEMGETAP